MVRPLFLAVKTRPSLNLDFDWLMARDWLLARNCDHIRGYLGNPNANLSYEERKLCDGIGEEK